MDFFSVNGVLDPTLKWLFIGIGIAIVAGFGLYTRALGRPLMFFLILIMIPLATTEIGTDGWITGIMEGVAENFHPGWILVYTSAIMMVLRFCAGPIVHRISPLGLLAASAVLAIAGLYTLSFTTGVMIFAAATLYGVGKTFFWPTMLGVVAEQTPRGGALTLNAMGGIGMIAVGVLGFPFIGALQAQKQIDAVAASQDVAQVAPSLTQDGKLTVVESKKIYEIIPYDVISDDKVAARLGELPAEKQAEAQKVIASVKEHANQRALASMALFPVVMLAGFVALIVYFRSRGGYKAQVLAGHGATDGQKFTGGVTGPADK